MKKIFEEQLEALTINGKVMTPCIYKRICKVGSRYLAYTDTGMDIYNSDGTRIDSKKTLKES